MIKKIWVILILMTFVSAQELQSKSYKVIDAEVSVGDTESKKILKSKSYTAEVKLSIETGEKFPSKNISDKKMELFINMSNSRSRSAYKVFLNAIKYQIIKPDQLKIFYVIRKEDGKYTSYGGPHEILHIKRALIIEEYWPEKYYEYLTLYDPYEKNPDNVITLLNIDIEQLNEKIKISSDDLIEKNIAAVNENEVYYGPQLFIDGEQYTKDITLSNLSIILNRKKVEKWTKEELELVCLTSKELDIFDDSKLFDELIGVSLNVIYYEDNDGKNIFNKYQMDSLPVIIINREQHDDSRLLSISDDLIERAGGYLYIYEGKPRYYPLRKKRTEHLDLFVMSHCPYGITAENSLLKFRDTADIQIHFIMDEVEKTDPEDKFPKKYSSIHGASEVEENLRQLCIISIYNDKYWSYLEKRNKDPKSSYWYTIADTIEMKRELIDECVFSGVLENTVNKGLQLQESLEIKGSPTILWENRLILGLADLKMIKGFEELELKNIDMGSCNK